MKAVFFDLDGVLVDLVQVHHSSLDSALNLFGYEGLCNTSKFRFNGLPTRTKLKMIDIPEKDRDKIIKAKQELTHIAMNQVLCPDKEKISLLYKLKMYGYNLACVTNSIRQTADLALSLSFLDIFMSAVVSNEDIERPKPHPDPYRKAMEMLGVTTGVAIEDNENGIWSARDAGLKVIQVSDPSEVNISLIEKIEELT